MEGEPSLCQCESSSGICLDLPQHSFQKGFSSGRHTHRAVGIVVVQKNATPVPTCIIPVALYKLWKLDKSLLQLEVGILAQRILIQRSLPCLLRKKPQAIEEEEENHPKLAAENHCYRTSLFDISFRREQPPPPFPSLKQF